MTLAAQIIADATGVFLNESDFAEDIVYKPRDGRPRHISAIVERNPPESLTEMEGGVAPRLVIKVANDEQDGIASHLWSTGDQVHVRVRINDPVEWRTIVDILADHDHGMCKFTVR